MTVGEYLCDKNIYIDNDGRIHFSILCDGTLMFAIDLVDAVVQFGCTDVKYGGYVDKEHAPKDKPWCNYRYTASGEIPHEIKESILERWPEVPTSIKDYLSEIYRNDEVSFQGTMPLLIDGVEMETDMKGGGEQ